MPSPSVSVVGAVGSPGLVGSGGGVPGSVGSVGGAGGAGREYGVKAPGRLPVPAGTITWTSSGAPAGSAGVMALITVPDSTTAATAGTPPMRTWGATTAADCAPATTVVAWRNPTPVIRMLVPPESGPLAG